MILDYPSGSSVIPRILKSREGKQKKKIRASDMSMEEWPGMHRVASFDNGGRSSQAEDRGCPLAAKKGKGIDFPLKYPERNAALLIMWF